MCSNLLNISDLIYFLVFVFFNLFYDETPDRKLVFVYKQERSRQIPMRTPS